jgi:hypothetical protein
MLEEIILTRCRTDKRISRFPVLKSLKMGLSAGYLGKVDPGLTRFLLVLTIPSS